MNDILDKNGLVSSPLVFGIILKLSILFTNTPAKKSP